MVGILLLPLAASLLLRLGRDASGDLRHRHQRGGGGSS
jgi:hypothetical protein